MGYGICDIPKCDEPTFLGWRPLTESIGRQVCETHWQGHKNGTFDLYESFGFRRPLASRQKTRSETEYCQCGNEMDHGRRSKFCPSCIAERKRQQRKESYHRKKDSDKSIRVSETILICRNEDCQNERQANHRYCDICAVRQRRKLDRIRKKKIRRNKDG